jgi:hypothetical protein
MNQAAPHHDHNGQYVRTEPCAPMRRSLEVLLDNLNQKVERTHKLTMLVLSFQFVTLGGLLLRWAID